LLVRREPIRSGKKSSDSGSDSNSGTDSNNNDNNNGGSDNSGPAITPDEIKHLEKIHIKGQNKCQTLDGFT
jgi:hypothetical protein